MCWNWFNGILLYSAKLEGGYFQIQIPRVISIPMLLKDLSHKCLFISPFKTISILVNISSFITTIIYDMNSFHTGFWNWTKINNKSWLQELWRQMFGPLKRNLDSTIIETWIEILVKGQVFIHWIFNWIF
jgi:hypothetical protein